MKQMKIRIESIAPMIMQSAQLVDPLDPVTKAIKLITDKRTKKTEDDLERLGNLEYQGCLYMHPDHGPIMPAANVERMMRDAATATKRGRDVKKGMQMLQDYAVVEYDGPRDLPGLRADGRFRIRTSVGVNGKRVMRVRPIFPEWALEFTLSYDPQVFNADAVKEILEAAGRYIGIGTWRPRFGRFDIVKAG